MLAQRLVDAGILHRYEESDVAPRMDVSLPLVYRAICECQFLLRYWAKSSRRILLPSFRTACDRTSGPNQRHYLSGLPM